MTRRSVESRLAALAAADPAEWPSLVRFAVPDVSEYLSRFPPRLFRVLAVRPQSHRRVEVVLSRVLSVTMTAAVCPGGWRVDVTGRETDPQRMQLSLVGPVEVGSLLDLARALSDARVARRLALTCRGGAAIPLCLEAGFATAPGRLWTTEAEAGDGRLTVRGWEWPLVLTLRVAEGPWTLSRVRPARPAEISRMTRPTIHP